MEFGILGPLEVRDGSGVVRGRAHPGHAQPATAASVLAGAALTALDPDALAAAQAGGRALTAEEALAEVIASA